MNRFRMVCRYALLANVLYLLDIAGKLTEKYVTFIEAYINLSASILSCNTWYQFIGALSVLGRAAIIGTSHLTLRAQFNPITLYRSCVHWPNLGSMGQEPHCPSVHVYLGGYLRGAGYCNFSFFISQYWPYSIVDLCRPTFQGFDALVVRASRCKRTTCYICCCVYWLCIYAVVFIFLRLGRWLSNRFDLIANDLLSILMVVFEFSSAILNTIRCVQAFKAHKQSFKEQKDGFQYLLFEQGSSLVNAAQILLNSFPGIFYFRYYIWLAPKTWEWALSLPCEL